MWSYAARYQRPECTTRPCGLSSRRVSSPEKARYPERTRFRRRIASARRSTVSPVTGAPAGAARVKSSVDSSASTRRRSPSGSTRWIFASAVSIDSGERQPELPRGDDAERDDDGLVVAQHQRRQPVPGPDPVAPADAALALDRDPEILERGHVAPDRARVDSEAVGDLAPGGERPGLEELEQVEEPCGGGQHDCKSSRD